MKLQRVQSSSLLFFAIASVCNYIHSPWSPSLLQIGTWGCSGIASMAQQRQRRFVSRFGWRRFLAQIIILLVILNMWLMVRAIWHQPFDENSKSSTQFKLPKPIFVVGFPKTGTTSIHAMFSCAGLKSSHYCCCGSNITHTDCKDGRTFSKCIRDNKKAGQPILEGCGDYDVYAQMDAELGRTIHLPQYSELDLLHAYAPHATFLLNLRPAREWMNSVTHWYGLGGRFLTHFNVDINRVNRNQALEDIYNNHTQFIRDFVELHPSHALVEVDISSPTAGAFLADAFGVPASCWGLHNPNKKRSSQ